VILFQVFVLCFHGSSIKHQSEQFMFDLLGSDWVYSDVKYQKMMIIVMENLKQPMSLRAFGLNEVNLEYFVQVRMRRVLCDN
jgi:hypothetical protein